jgi:hypothetical protein
MVLAYAVQTTEGTVKQSVVVGGVQSEHELLRKQQVESFG